MTDSVHTIKWTETALISDRNDIYELAKKLLRLGLLR